MGWPEPGSRSAALAGCVAVDPLAVAFRLWDAVAAVVGVAAGVEVGVRG